MSAFTRTVGTVSREEQNVAERCWFLPEMVKMPAEFEGKLRSISCLFGKRTCCFDLARHEKELTYQLAPGRLLIVHILLGPMLAPDKGIEGNNRSGKNMGCN